MFVCLVFRGARGRKGGKSASLKAAALHAAKVKVNGAQVLALPLQGLLLAPDGECGAWALGQYVSFR